MFSSLSSRNLRLFLGGQVVSVIGTWLQKAAQAWLVLELTGSGTWLGVTAALQQLPTLAIGLWGGLLADRMDKRRLLLFSQSVSILPAITLGVLTVTGAVQLWMVLALALVLGTIDAFDKPARHTFVTEVVSSRDDVTNAVTLNSVIQNFGKVTGPALAGLLIVGVGLPVTFFLNAASFVTVIIGLLLVRPERTIPVVRAAREKGQVREGLRYIRATPSLLGPLVLMAVSGTLAYEWAVTLPLFARDTFGGDARVFGFMFSAMGLGSVLGGLTLAGLLTAGIRSLVITGLSFSMLMVLLAVAPGLEVALVLLFLVGAASVAFRAVANSHLQLTAKPEMRGRVMAVLLVAVLGTTPIGGPLVGWISEALDPRVAFAVGGLGTAVSVVGMMAYLRRANRQSSDSESTCEVPGRPVVATQSRVRLGG
jgi:MFS family permease